MVMVHHSGWAAAITKLSKLLPAWVHAACRELHMCIASALTRYRPWPYLDGRIATRLADPLLLGATQEGMATHFQAGMAAVAAAAPALGAAALAYVDGAIALVALDVLTQHRLSSAVLARLNTSSQSAVTPGQRLLQLLDAPLSQAQLRAVAADWDLLLAAEAAGQLTPELVYVLAGARLDLALGSESGEGRQLLDSVFRGEDPVLRARLREHMQALVMQEEDAGNVARTEMLLRFGAWRVVMCADFQLPAQEVAPRMRSLLLRARHTALHAMWALGQPGIGGEAGPLPAAMVQLIMAALPDLGPLAPAP